MNKSLALLTASLLFAGCQSLAPTPDGGWECVRWGAIYPPFERDRPEIVDDPMG